MRFCIIFVLIYTAITFRYTESASVNWCEYDCSGNYKNVVCQRGAACAPTENCKEIQDFTDEIREILLDEHNKYRSLVALGKEASIPTNLRQATNMMTLSWSRELEMAAKCHVMQCPAYQDHWCRKTPGFTEFGQNFAAFTSNKENCNSTQFVRMAINQWQTKHKDIALDQGNQDEDFSDYYQLIWAKTTHLGCSVSQKVGQSSQSMCFIACNYASNNLIKDDSIYTQGKPCSGCPNGELCNPLYEGLCGNNYGPNGNIAKLLFTGKYEDTTRKVDVGKIAKTEKAKLYKPPGFNLQHDKDNDGSRYLVFNEFGDFKIYDKNDKTLKLDTRVTFWSPMLPMYDYLEDIVFRPSKEVKSRRKSRKHSNNAETVELSEKNNHNGVRKRARMNARSQSHRTKRHNKNKVSSNEDIYDFVNFGPRRSEIYPKSTYLIKKNRRNLGSKYFEKKNIMNSRRRRKFYDQQKTQHDTSNSFKDANFRIGNIESGDLDQSSLVRRDISPASGHHYRSKLYTMDKTPLWIRTIGFGNKINASGKNLSKNKSTLPEKRLKLNREETFNGEDAVKDIIKLLLQSSVESLKDKPTRKETETRILIDILDEIAKGNETNKTTDVSFMNIIYDDPATRNTTASTQSIRLQSSISSKSQNGEHLGDESAECNCSNSILQNLRNHFGPLETADKPEVKQPPPILRIKEEFDDSDIVYSILHAMMEYDEANQYDRLGNTTNNRTNSLINGTRHQGIIVHELNEVGVINLTMTETPRQLNTINSNTVSNNVNMSETGIKKDTPVFPETETGENFEKSNKTFDMNISIPFGYSYNYFVTKSNHTDEIQTMETQKALPEPALVLLDSDDIFTLNSKSVNNNMTEENVKNETKSTTGPSEIVIRNINGSNNSSVPTKNETNNTMHIYFGAKQVNLERNITSYNHTTALEAGGNNNDRSQEEEKTSFNFSNQTEKSGAKNETDNTKHNHLGAEQIDVERNITSNNQAIALEEKALSNFANQSRESIDTSDIFTLNREKNSGETVGMDKNQREPDSLNIENKTTEIRALNNPSVQNKTGSENILNRFLRSLEYFIGN